MQGPAAERFVVLNLRLLARSFAVVGILFLAVPSGVLDVISDVGEWFGNDTRAPHTQEYLWLALSFAYMVLITVICLVAQTDVVRYRALIAILAIGKTTSSLTALAFFLIQEHGLHLPAQLPRRRLPRPRGALALGPWRGGSAARRTPVDSARRGSRPLSNAPCSAICAAMAPGVDGLPAAERDVEVSGPVAASSRSALPAPAAPARLGLRAFEWLPFPWRFSRLDPAAREDFLLRLEGSRFSLHHDLLLMAKVFSTLGYAVTPEVEERIGFEIGCALRRRRPARAGRAAGRPRARRRGRGMRRGRRRLRRRRRRRRRQPGRGGPRRDRARGRRPLQPRELPERPPRGDRHPLPRRRPDHRRRPAADPGAGGAGARRHHRDQLRHLLPRPRPGAGGLADPVRDRLGAQPRRRLRRGRRVPPRHPARPDRDGAQRPAGDGGRGSDRRQRRADLPQRRQLRAVQLLPFGCTIDAKRGMHVSYLPRAAAAGARIRAGVEAGRVLVEDGRAVGVSCRAAHRGRALAPLRGPRPARGARSPAVRSARRSCCSARGSATATSAPTSTSTPPAGSAPATRRRCAAGRA